MDSLTERKVVVVGAAVLIGVGLVFAKGDVPANFLTLLQWAVGFFTVGISVEHAANAYTDVNAAAPVTATVDPTAQITDLATKVDHLAQTDQALGQGIGVVQQTLTAIMNHYNIPGA